MSDNHGAMAKHATINHWDHRKLKHREREPKESQIPYLAVELDIIQVREQASSYFVGCLNCELISD